MTGLPGNGVSRLVPAGPGSDDFIILLRLVPPRIEVMDLTAQAHPHPSGLVPAVVERAGTSWKSVPAERSTS
ncbi:MAG: hypothetical protein M3381_10445 [Actinomycetota bacterium]|nr:hypothetical protein [Actinomycetota bacterium]